MTASWLGIAFLVAAMLVESFAQLFLKIGATGGPRILASPYRELAGRSRLLASAASWLAAGVVFYVLEIALYTLALHHLDVSIAFPMGSLCFVGVALLSKLFLGEAVDRFRWIGIGFILLGTSLLAL